MGSVFLSYYAQPAYRKNREVAHFIFDCFDMVFKAGIPVICGLIQQRLTPEETNNFIRLHAKMGYQWRGRLPYFFDGKDCHMVALTKEDWEKPNLRLAKMQERWRKNRESKKAQQEEPVG